MKSKIRNTRIFGIALLLIGSVAIWILVLNPRLHQPTLFNTQKDQAIAKKKSLDNQVLAIVASKKDLASAQQKIDLISQRFPSAANATEFQDEVTAAITKTGISLSNIQGIALGKATVSTTDTTSANMSVDINVSGSYDQLAAVVDNLYSIKRALSIDSVSIAGTANAGSTTTGAYTLRVSGQTFLFSAIPPIPAGLFK